MCLKSLVKFHFIYEVKKKPFRVCVEKYSALIGSSIKLGSTVGFN